MATDTDCIDDAEEYDAERFGGFSAEEVASRGRLDLTFKDAHVRSASARVKESGVLKFLRRWHTEDNPTPGVGGRPRIIDDHAILVGLMLLAQEHSPLFMRNLSVLFQHRLTPESRILLGLPAPDENPSGYRLERQRWEKNTNNTFHRILTLMDPFPMNRYVSLTYTQVQEILDAHDEHREQRMKKRLDTFTNAFLLMSFNEQPRRVRRASRNIDLSIDQTFIAPPTKKGYSKKKLAARVRAEAADDDPEPRSGPVDPFAGWYAKKDDSGRHDYTPGTRDSTSPEDSPTSYTWGWMVNTSVRVDSERPGTKRFPKLAMAVTLSLPNVGVSEEAVNVLRYALDTGLDAGIVSADKQYFALATVERLHQPVADLGFQVSTEYRIDRLGVQGGKAGAEYIEGDVYCPGMPQTLKDTNKEFMAGTIDNDTFRLRIEERRAFVLRNKEKPDAKGRTPKMCPALGNSPTVTCPVREMSKKAADKPRPGVNPEDVPEFLDKICKQHSVQFTEEDLIRQRQAFQYQSQEWEEFQTHARQSIESLHEGFKDPGTEQLELSGRRRVRGFAAAQVFTTILLVNYNLRKIASFLYNEVHGITPPVSPIVRRRDRLWYNPYTKTIPRESALELQRAGKLSPRLRT